MLVTRSRACKCGLGYLRQVPLVPPRFPFSHGYLSNSMTELDTTSPSGVAAHWPSRKSVIGWIEKTTPWSIESAVAYNKRVDTGNVAKAPPRGAYFGVGVRLLGKAVALALRGEPWELEAIDALGYIGLAAQLDIFWHVQFRIQFPEHPRPLRMFDWELTTEAMAMFEVLGRTYEATYLGYLTHAALNRVYQLQLSYEERHRRVHSFMLRLFSEWRGDVRHEWPSFAYSEPVYEGILERWRESDPEILTPWLLVACDRHTHESKRDSATKFYDCSAFPRTPLEILYLFRLRELVGLRNPVLNHPLLEVPFDKLPEPQPAYVPDDLVRGTLARVHEDWPDFDEIVSLESLNR